VKKVSIGFSPCPNDTFIFDALINKRIPSGEYHFEPVLADVEQLNRLAMKSKLDVTKISFGAYARASENYMILDSGAALGKGVGPVLVAKRNISKSELAKSVVAIPGLNTTANLLLSVLFPEIKNKKEAVFSEIEGMVVNGEADAGLLIHEGRFTFAKKNLLQLYDLGELWETVSNFPLPLGCIAANRRFSTKEQIEISGLIRQSIEFAYAHPEAGNKYIKEHAQEMDDSVIASHIKLYVNEFSINLGPEGKAAIMFLLNKGVETGLLPSSVQPIFNSDSI